MADAASDGIDYASLRNIIIRQFSLGPRSIHGPSHWDRVGQIGARLCETSGADRTVVQLFSLFHDSRRWNESWDPNHGSRGAKLALEMRGTHFVLDDARFETLSYACIWHTSGKLSQDATIGTCWDSDRLDLSRVGVIPKAELLSTEAARERKMIQWAMGLPK